MPRLDGTGPKGQGALSGRGLGECNGAQARQGRRARQGQRQGQQSQGFCQRFRLSGSRGAQGMTMESLHTQIASLQASIEQLKVLIAQH